MSKNPATCCNFTKSYSTLTNSYNTLCIAKHGILDPEYTEKLTASAGDFVLQTPYRGSALWGGGPCPPNVRHKSPPLQIWTWVGSIHRFYVLAWVRDCIL